MKDDVRPPQGRSRGYWVDGGPSATPDPATQTRAGGRRRLLRWAVAVVMLAGVATVAALVLTGRMVVPGLSERIFPIHYPEDIARAAQKYGQDPYLVAAVVKAESGYDPDAVSKVGAVGLMQLMPDTAAWIAAELSLWEGDENPDFMDPIDNLELGVCYLAYLGETFGDGSQLTLAAYNAGPGTVAEWIEAAGADAGFDLADIQFPETRHYVERVEHYRHLYVRIHSGLFDLTDVWHLTGVEGGSDTGRVTETRSGDDPSR